MHYPFKQQCYLSMVPSRAGYGLDQNDPNPGWSKSGGQQQGQASVNGKTWNATTALHPRSNGNKQQGRMSSLLLQCLLLHFLSNDGDDASVAESRLVWRRVVRASQLDTDLVVLLHKGRAPTFSASLHVCPQPTATLHGRHKQSWGMTIWGLKLLPSLYSSTSKQRQDSTLQMIFCSGRRQCMDDGGRFTSAQQDSIVKAISNPPPFLVVQHGSRSSTGLRLQQECFLVVLWQQLGEGWRGSDEVARI